VVVVDVEPGTLATVTSIPLTTGRRLRRETGTWDELAARADELADAYLDLTVQVGGADVDLGRRAAEAFPYLVNVRAQRPAAERRVRSAGERPTDDGLYAEYVRGTTGEDPPDELVALFREVLDEALDATA
jgi:hypothetical protein